MTKVTTLEEFDKLSREAEQTACGIPNCNGNGHDPLVGAADWHHQVLSIEFDNGIVDAGITRMQDGTCEGDILFAGGGTMTAAEFRAAADQYEAFPAWLRAIADVMDSRSAN